MKNDVDFGAALFGVVASFVSLVFVYGYVLSLLWLWFLVPLGVPAITNLVGAGIILLVRLILFCAQGIEKSNKEDDLTWKFVLTKLITSYILNAFILGIAYVITLFM